MDREELIYILEKSFNKRWENLSYRPYVNSTYELSNYFLIDNILEDVNFKIKFYEKNSDSYISRLRYQKYILTYLSSEFAFILFFVSDKGNNINEETIIESQKYLKNSGKCKIYPCTKLF